MLGFADAWMGAAQFRANEEQRANERALAARRMAMAEQEHQMNQREAGLRLGAMEEAKRYRDELIAEETQALGGPGGMAAIPPVSRGPAMDPQLAMTLENNAPLEGMVEPPVQAMPAPGTRPPAAPRASSARRRYLASQGRVEDLERLDKEARAEALQEARRTEFKRLQSLPPDQVVQQFNQLAQGAGLKAMIAWNPKARNFEMRSEVPGLDSGSVGYGEMLQSIMGLWEAGNGDMEAGFRLISGGIRAQREAGEGAFDRSAKFAGSQSGAFYDNLRADNDAARLNLSRAQADRQRRSELVPLGVSTDQKTLFLRDPGTGAVTTQPIPTGEAGIALIRSLRPERQGPTPEQLVNAAQKLLDADPNLTPQGAMEQVREMYALASGQGNDPAVNPLLAIAERRAREKMEAEARRKGSEGPAYRFQQAPPAPPPRATPMDPATGALPPRW